MIVQTSEDRQDWDSMLPSVSEDRLLLLEHAHRVGNETAAALAALHLARNAKGPKARIRMMSAAVARLGGFASVNRALMVADAARLDLALEIERLCAGLTVARTGLRRSRMILDLRPVEVDGTTARRVLMVVAELLQNAIRHALDGRAGRVAVVLRRVGGDVVVSVIDDGPGVGASPVAGSGMGGPITRELVRRAGGSIDCDTGPHGTALRVVVPIAGEERPHR